MKTDRRGPVTARTSSDGDETAIAIKPPLRRTLATVAIVAVVLVSILIGRHAIAGFALARGLSAVTGDKVDVGSFILGRTQIVLSGVHVRTHAGDTLLDAEQVAIRYSLHDVVWGGRHRFGISELTVRRPVFTIVRHADASYNLSAAKPMGGGAATSAGPAAPLSFHVRIGEGTLRLIDRAPVAPDLGQQIVRGISLEGQIASDRQTRISGHATLVGRRTTNAIVQDWPITLSVLADAPRGLEILRARARVLPMRGAVGYVQHSAAVRVDDGLLHDLDCTFFALNVGLDQPVDLRAGGHADLTDGRLTIAALRKPVRGLHGRLTLTDDGVWSKNLAGTLAGVPLVAGGGAFDRLKPELRLGIRAAGELTDLRSMFAFSAKQPVSGRATVETLIEAPVSNLLIRTALGVAHGAYGKIPLANVGGRIDYHASSVVLDAVRGRYGAAGVSVGGRFLLGGTALDSTIAVAAHGSGRSLPYAENIAPEADVDALAIITGGDGYRARGALGFHGNGLDGRAMFAVGAAGVGEFGPFAFERNDGSSLIGALRLERPTSRSAAWLSARGYRVTVPSSSAKLLGLTIPAFPPIGGTIDAALAGGGSPDVFGVTGRVRGRDLRVGNIELGAGQARIGGTLRDVRLSAIALDGPAGRFRGDAAAGDGVFGLRGQYDGSLDRLVPLTGKQLAHGAVHGSVLATLSGRNIVVQSARAVLHGATIRGVAFEAAAGTVAVRNSAFHIIVANGMVGGRSVVARESAGTVAVSAPDLPSGALRGTGLPLDAGNLSVYGVADLRGTSPSFDGTVAVAGGRSVGYAVSGDAQIDLDGKRATVFAATGALGSTYGSIDGAIDGIGERALRYDLDTRVPLGDIDLLRRDLRLPVRYLAGSYVANLHVHGSGSHPFVDGTLNAPEGVYNGLAFRDAAARVVLDADGVAARNGRLTVGTTRATIAASTGRAGFAVAASAPQADLADFNDYFDASDTLAGHGRFDLRFQNAGGRTRTQGLIAFQGLRYRTFPLGDTTANWRMRGSAIGVAARVASAAGSLAATGLVSPAAGGDPIRSFRAAAYNVHVNVDRIDLGTWLPAGQFDEPVLGKVDARLDVAGRWPRLSLGIDATLRDATLAGFPVHSGHLRATSVGTRINVADSTAELDFANFSGSGTLGLGPTDGLLFDLRATTPDVGRAIRTFVPLAQKLDVGGGLDADLRLTGTRAKPRIEGGFDLENARYGTFRVPRAIGALALAGRSIELRDADVEFSRGQAFVAGSLPLTLQPFGFGPPRAALSFDVTARGVDLTQFEPLLVTGTKLAGTVDGRFGVEGTVDRPRMLGSLAIANGSYLSSLERAPIANVDARFNFAGSSVALQTFHADVGGGTLDAGGRINLPIGSNSHTSYALDVRAKSAKLDFPAFGRGTIDGNLRLTGGSEQPLVSGDIALRDAVIPVAAVYGSGSTPGGGGAGGGLPIDPKLDVRAAVGKNVRVRNSIIDIGVTGAVDVAGSLRAPRLAGGFTATDGTVSSYNHVFRVVNASAIFDPADGILPTIDARATARVTNPDPDPSRNIAGSANITVTVSGTPDSNNLQVAYSSDPSYSQEQIVGLLLDVPALLGALNFNLNSGPGSALLRGAPGETNVLLPPGVSPEQVSAISFNQEVFSLLNGQFTQRALNPIERVFAKVFGLSDLEFTVDYGGGLGYSLRRQIGKRDFYAFASQTVSYPERSNIGFELEPKPFETVNFSLYQQNGVTSLITNQTPGAPFSLGSTRRLTSVQPLGNRSGFSLNFNRRF